MTRKNNLTLITFIFLCIGALLTGCEGTAESGGGSVNVVKVTGKELIKPDGKDPAAEKVAQGVNDFAFRLSAGLLKSAGNENFVCSPYSAWMPLAALVNATNPEVKDALFTALGARGAGDADMNNAASRMLYDLTGEREKEYEGYYNPLKIANIIFVDYRKTLNREFAQTFMDYYRGSSMNVDFHSPDAVDIINRWASDNTEGLITNLLTELNPDTIAAIANAIYFSDRWSWEFDPLETKEDVFHGPEGNGTANYMFRQGDAAYYEDGKVQALPLDFKNGGGMYIILPKSGGAADLLSSMTNEYFTTIQRKSVDGNGKLLLPRFSIENTFEDRLTETLIRMGVPLFGGDSFSVPLTGLIEPIPGDFDFGYFISDAIQKAVIEVDEKGTTAAAVTIYPIDASSPGPGDEPPPVPFEMICDKPFVFILYKYTSDGGSQILFTGVVNQP